ncbi:Putative trypsin-like serine protease [Gryllus bimaculatus]|nr:Putative trypsin-like serine protease [Gryllus bimaculatus]
MHAAKRVERVAPPGGSRTSCSPPRTASKIRRRPTTEECEYPNALVLPASPPASRPWDKGAKAARGRGACGRRGPARWVRLGDLDLSTPLDDDRAQELAVAQRVAHPGYRDGVKYFDRAVAFGSAVRPACLHTRIDPLPARATATGWGRLEESKTRRGPDDKEANGPLSDRLLKVDLPLVPQDTCRRVFEPFNHSRVSEAAFAQALPAGIAGGMVCAGGAAGGGRDACAGDSGGPLQAPLPAGPRCVHAVLGVTSFGKGCARPGLPGVYARVAEFVPWIESVVWPEEVAALNDLRPRMGRLRPGSIVGAVAGPAGDDVRAAGLQPEQEPFKESNHQDEHRV